jgi:hypothetical protein
MTATLKPASTFLASRSPIVDSNGNTTFAFTKVLQGWDTKLSNGLNQLGQLIGEINPTTVIAGRTEGIGTTVANIDSAGVVQYAGLVAATDTTHGAVTLPSGATSNVLGSAAVQSTSAFDASGAAAQAQLVAQAFASTAANTAQSNAEAFASDASNLSSGTVPLGRLPGLTVTIATAKLTGGGTDGSMVFQNGILMSQVAAT